MILWRTIRALASRELLALGVRDLQAHQLRSLLTTLGMIFGVGAVVCMLSIGEGASADQMASIRMLGSRNIILRSIQPPSSSNPGDSSSRVLTYGLKRDDVTRIAALPGVREVVQMRNVADEATRGSRKLNVATLGTTPNFFNVVNVGVQRGRSLLPADALKHRKVCVIGSEVASDLFATEDPLGQHLTVQAVATGPIPYEIVGVLAPVQTAGRPAKGAGARDINRDVYVPLSTVDMRYGDIKVRYASGSRERSRIEVSDVYVHVDDEPQVVPVSKMVERVLASTHQQLDYSIVVPLELLRQARQSKRTWQIVLGSIASISLLVGGIGIMNIMLASVTERTREIGIRRALGAKRYHITAQFLVETLLLSLSGGLIGVIAGIGLAAVVTWTAGWQTIVPWWGVGLSFGVSALVGISFGLYPAYAAAGLDPIEALRHE